MHIASLMIYFILKGRGLTGLKNLGNSCYMNSIIQCINNTTPLVRYFCLGEYHEDVNHHNNSTRGEVAEEVAAVVRALWCGEFRSIACRDLKRVVGQHRKQFRGYEQQDSHEFLTILMDWLHEDLNKVQIEVKREFKICKLSEGGGHIDMQTPLLQLHRIFKKLSTLGDWIITVLELNFEKVCFNT